MKSECFYRTYYALKRWKYNHIDGTYRMSNVNCGKGGTAYYVIRRLDKAGFFSNFIYVLGHMQYALQKGYIPVVDMKNYPTLYHEGIPVKGTMNDWEYYFTQKASVEEAYSSKSCILSDNFYIAPFSEMFRSSSVPNDHIVKNLNATISMCIDIENSIRNEIDSFWEANTNGDEKILAVHIRGTDMKCTPDHPAPPSLTQYMNAVDELMKEERIDKIFLCSDEQRAVEVFQDKYGDMLFVTDCYRAKDEDSTTGIHQSNFDRPLHRYLLGKEVLIDTVCLSKSNVLICCNSNLSRAALAFNGNSFCRVVYLG